MKRRKTGVWLIGALGSISTTVIVGALELRKGHINPTGMVTTGSLFHGVPLVAAEDLEFGGCDIRASSLRESAAHLVEESGFIGRDLLTTLQPEIDKIQDHIRQGTAINCGEAIEGLQGGPQMHCQPLRDQITSIRDQLSAFKRALSLDNVVVVNLASTEPPLSPGEQPEDLAALETRLDGDQPQGLRASTLYAYAAIQEGCPYINFTPSNAALQPALIQLAQSRAVPVMGNDGKTGETLVKSALAPLFVYRNLEVLSWEGFNLLGNMDGRVLDNPMNKEAKLRTKDQVLSRILGYSPHSRVHIDYVPSLDDQKTAWDFIHFRGFMGAKMSLQFIWQGYDSILAAPLVLDLARLADFAKLRGEAGLMTHLASYFKAPLGVDVFDLHQQHGMLAAYAARAREDTQRDHPTPNEHEG